jgi:hypothetical protein
MHDVQQRSTLQQQTGAAGVPSCLEPPPNQAHTCSRGTGLPNSTSDVVHLLESTAVPGPLLPVRDHMLTGFQANSNHYEASPSLPEPIVQPKPVPTSAAWGCEPPTTCAYMWLFTDYAGQQLTKSTHQQQPQPCIVHPAPSPSTLDLTADSQE